MAHSITVHSQEDFENLMKSNNYEISTAIVKSLLKNLKSKKRFIHILEVNVVEEHSIYDITLDREDILDSLESNLKIQEVNENYEVCSEIVKAIAYVKEQQSNVIKKK
jgi:hypothetical protein